MEINKSDLFKQREFSELISDTINFYIREAKSLFKYIFKYIVLFLVVKSLVANYYAYIFTLEYETYPNLFELLRFGSGEMIRFVLILKFIDFLQYTMLIVVIGAYVKLYISNGIVEKKDLGREIKTLFLKITASNFLIGTIILLSLIALVLPAIYLSVVFSIVPIIIIFEKISVGKAVSKSLQMFKGNWWKSFGAFLVISLMYLIFSLIISLIFSRFFLLFRFIPFVMILSSVFSGTLYAFASALPVFLAVILYTSLVGQETSNKTTKNQSVKTGKEKHTETKNKEILHKDEERENLQNDGEPKNRFLDDNETNRFKPKY